MRTSFAISGLAVLPLVMACGSKPFTFGNTGASQGSGGAGGETTSTSSEGSGAGTTTSTSSTATGASGTGGTGTAGSTGTTTTGTEPCPGVEPVSGTTCPGATIIPCHYKPYPCCEDDVATCAGTTWSVAQGSCPAPTCPANVPSQGAACGCPQAKLCDYPGTCPGGMNQSAFCNNGLWQVGSSPCSNPMPIQCGTTTCTAGTQVCVRVGSNAVGCAADPCPMNEYDCTCAHTACPMDHPLCLGTDGPYVNCQ